MLSRRTLLTGAAATAAVATLPAAVPESVELTALQLRYDGLAADRQLSMVYWRDIQLEIYRVFDASELVRKAEFLRHG